MGKDSLANVLKKGVELTKEIVAEILSTDSDLLTEIGMHDQYHRLNMIKSIVFSFISIKGKQLCRSENIDNSTMIRHKNTKEVIFKHE